MGNVAFEIEQEPQAPNRPAVGLRDRSEVQDIIVAAVNGILESAQADFIERFGEPTPPPSYRRFPKTHPSGAQPKDRIKAWPIEAIIGANADGTPRMTAAFLRYAVASVLRQRIQDITRTLGGENGEWRVLSITPVRKLDRERLPVTKAPEGGTEKFIVGNPSWVDDAGAKPTTTEQYREVDTIYFDVVFVDISGNPWLQRDGLGRPVDNAAATGGPATGGNAVADLAAALRQALHSQSAPEAHTEVKEVKVEGEPKKVSGFPPRPKA